MKRERVLIVEDEPDIRDLLEFNLSREGFQTTAVETGPEALEAAANDRPDVILLDLLLPGMDGLDVCRQLRRRDETAQIPLIMLTAKGEESDIVLGLGIGADDYIVKPFSPQRGHRSRPGGAAPSQRRAGRERCRASDRARRSGHRSGAPSGAGGRSASGFHAH